MDNIDNIAWSEYIAGLKCPPYMPVSRQFIDHIAALAAANRSPQSGKELNKTVTQLTGAMLEVINALGALDEGMRRRVEAREAETKGPE